MIYIDPPYNTGNDSFIYPDKFSETKEEYLKRVGDKDEEGYMTKDGLFHKNSKENGQYHSNWLNMMYPRLFLAKNLLKDDGVIFVSIDDNEVHNLRLMMNEIFGEESFVANFIWKSRVSEDNRKLTGASIDHEYIVCYSKGKAVLNGILKDLNKFTNPDNDERVPWRSADLTGLLTKDQRPNCHYDLINPKTGILYKCPPKGWRYDRNSMSKKVDENRILWPEKRAGRPRHKLFMNDMDTLNKNVSSVITEFNTQQGTREIDNFFGPGIFSFPKPSSLIKFLVSQGAGKEDIILDFYAGSATTTHAVIELNAEDAGIRKFICVQLPELCDINSEVYKAGYKTIADIAKERIRRVIKKIKDEQKEKLDFANNKQDLGFKVFKLSDSNFKQNNGNLNRRAQKNYLSK